MEEFNTKELTFVEDVPRAFSGIQAMLQTTYPEGILLGLLRLFFDICFLWAPSGDLKRRRPSASFEGGPFQDGLPSWSWMGWQVRTVFHKNLDYIANLWYMRFSQLMAEWYTMTTPKAPLKRIESDSHDPSGLLKQTTWGWSLVGRERSWT